MNSRDRRRQRRRWLQEEYSQRQLAGREQLVEDILNERRKINRMLEQVKVGVGQLNQLLAAGEAVKCDAMAVETAVDGDEFVVDLNAINDERRIFVEEEEERRLKEA